MTLMCMLYTGFGAVRQICLPWSLSLQIKGKLNKSHIFIIISRKTNKRRTVVNVFQGKFITRHKTRIEDGRNQHI